jgi:membrane-bound serine protease (ClpP class)
MAGTHSPPPKRRARVVATLAFALAVTLAFAQERPAEQGRPRYSNAFLIRFEGQIGPMLEQYVFRKLDAARREEADLVIVEIDSPGGTVEESLSIAERLSDIDWARTVAFVPQQAISGGAFVALGCDDIVMAPDALIGDAGVITMEEGFFFRYVPEKFTGPIRQKLRGLAETKGRPPALAEAMMDKELVVYHVENDQGDVGFMSEKEIDDAAHSRPPIVWNKGKPVFETNNGEFLVLNGVRAVELTLAQDNAGNRDELKKRLNVAGDFTVLTWTGVDTTVMVLNHPLITGLLFVVGLIALYVEFSAPGISAGGLIAGLCFALFFWSRFLGGTAGWLEVVLFVMGLVFLGMELFVLPGFGVSGLTGILLVIVSLVMASQNFAVPDTGPKMNTLVVNLLVVTGAMAAVIVSAIVLSTYFGTIPIVNQLALRPPAIDEESAAEVAGVSPVATALKGGSAAVPEVPLHVGEIGVADSFLRPAGKAVFADESYDVVTEGTFIEKGASVKIIKIQGVKVVVREVG